MCEVCEENKELDYARIEYSEQEGYELVIQTSEWDDYHDGWVYERININYCPFCGRKLGNLMKYVKLDDVKELLTVIDARDKFDDWTKSFEMFNDEAKILMKLLEQNAIELILKED